MKLETLKSIIKKRLKVLENYLIVKNMNFTKEEYKIRLKRVQKSMQDKGIELLISSDTANMNYLTGYDAWSFYYAQAVIVHVNAEEPLCWIRKQDSGGAYIKTYLQNLNERILTYKKKKKTKQAPP